MLLSCDTCVVFEGTYSTFQSYGISQNISLLQASSKSNWSRDKLACVMHAVPSSSDIDSLTDELRGLAGAVFVTGLSVNYYASFSPAWAEFADAMAA
jgi:hypothetical protein